MLKKIISLVGGLLAMPLGAGCTKGSQEKNAPGVDSRLVGRTFKADFEVPGDYFQEITGKQERGGTWSNSRFAEPLTFKQLEETVEGIGYWTFTPDDGGKAYTGKFAMRATLHKGYTGGPPGSATELFVEVNDVRLVEKLVPPKSPPGTKALLPGQFVVKHVKEEELSKLDDRYVIELPAGKLIRVGFQPWPEYYPYVLTMAKDGVPVQVRYDVEERAYLFETQEAGVYELRVQVKGTSRNVPDSYSFYMRWGVGLSSGGDLAEHRVEWKNPPVPDRE